MGERAETQLEETTIGVEQETEEAQLEEATIGAELETAEAQLEETTIGVEQETAETQLEEETTIGVQQKSSKETTTDGIPEARLEETTVSETSEAQLKETTSELHETQLTGEIQERQSTREIYERQSTGERQERQSTGERQKRQSTREIRERQSTGERQKRQSTGEIQETQSIGETPIAQEETTIPEPIEVPIDETGDSYIENTKPEVYLEKEATSEKLSVILNEEEEYDTDLEAEDKTVRSYKSITAEDLYYKACEQLGVVPVTYFVAHLHDEIINLSHHGLGPQGTKAIAAPLVVNTSVLELNLEDNWITAEGMKEIGDMLVENCYITTLNLSGNKFKTAGARLVSAMVQENTNLRELNLSRNDFIDKDARFFAEALRMNFRLKVLNLSGNAFCEIGGEWLGQAIANNEAIEHLNLSWNHLRRKGALAICAGMKSNITIKFLDLSWNGFCDDGAMAMGMALKNNNTLIWLDLSNNRISDKGAVMLAKGLEINDTLKTLKIGHNPIGNGGAMALINAIVKNPNSAIEDFDIKGVQVREEFLRAAQDLKHRAVDTSTSKTNFFLHVNAVDVSANNREKYSSLISSQDPMEVIQKFLEDKRLRLVDLFRNFDKDLSWKISPEEFQKGIQGAGVPLSKQQLKKLMNGLDIDRDGQVNYREFFKGRKQAILRRRERLKKEAKEKAKRKEEGKKRWSEWKQAIQITSATNLSAVPSESNGLRSRSLVAPGQKSFKKSSKAGLTDASNAQTLSISSRLTKSFVDPHTSSGHTFKRDKIPLSNELTVSIPSINTLQIESESSECLDVSIQIPDTDRTNQSNEETRSFLSVSYATPSPRHTGGTPNSRKKPPTR